MMRYDALLMAHPRREELAEALTASSAEFIKMISDQQGFAAEAIEVVKLMRASMLRRLGRTDPERKGPRAAGLIGWGASPCANFANGKLN